MKYTAVLLLTLLFYGTVFGISSTGSRVAVILDPGKEKAFKESHSLFWTSLQERGFETSFKSVEDVELIQYGELIYDHVLVFSEDYKKRGKISVDKMLNFIDAGGNAIIGSSDSPNRLTKDLAAAFGFVLAAGGGVVKDDLAYKHSTGGNDAPGIATNSFGEFLNGMKFNSIAFNGIAHNLQKENPLLFPLVSASPTSYIKATDGSACGQQLRLISALQTRSSSRVLFSGSIEFFANKFFVKADNEKFIQKVTEWVFQESFKLRVEETKHHKENETTQKEHYRIKDKIIYEISIEQHYPDGKWKPFKADLMNLPQLELIMLDPYVRVNFTAGTRPGRYIAAATLPDVYGVFSFNVELKRRGWTFISLKNSVPIHPFRHNEYPRFLSAAFPYYTGALSVMTMFWLFSLAFLFFRGKTKLA